jgi:alpha-L-fucosidase
MSIEYLLGAAQKRRTLFTGLLCAAMALIPFRMYAATTYQATWASVNKHTCAPEWFMDAKFGIYFHWGVYSVPAYGTEWYPRNMYNKSSGEYSHHVATFGDPFGDWQYHNFINGKNDKKGVFTQFAPKLKSAGGNFDPDEWATLFDSAGAKFAGPVAEHHDGFSDWDSKVNEWNAVAKGPKLDLAKLFATAIRAKGMKFVMTMHHAWGFTGYWQYPPVTQTDASLKKLYGQLPTAEEEQLWSDKLKEIIDGYQPDLIWQDLYLARIPEKRRLEFLAYYYNKAIDWNKEVVVTSKDGFQKGEMHDYERGGPADITYPYWLTDDAISSSTWCYTQGMGYYSTTQMLHSLIDRVSKNGNLLLDIAPMADGTIPQGQKNILFGIGDWLGKFGESIYSTRAWTVYGEGPTKMGGGAFTAPTAGNNKDWRFTRTKDTSTLYAICLGWPGNGAQVTISSITQARFAAKGVYLFGNTPGTFTQINFTQSAQGLTFTMPSTQPYTSLAYAFKITSSRSGNVAVNPAAVSSGRTVPPVPGALCYGPLPLGSIKTLKGIAGIEVYSLQGKKILRYMFDHTRNGNGLVTLRMNNVPQVYYMKYLTGKNGTEARK